MEISEGLLDILKCPDCEQSNLIVLANKSLKCTSCKREFNFDKYGILKMLPSHKTELPPIYSDADYIKWQEVFPEVFESRGLIHKIIDESTHRWVAHTFNKRSMRGWIIDLGCGIGDHFRHFKKIANVIGVDINEPALHKCREKYGDIILIQGDIYHLPFRNGVIAQVLALHILEHMYYLNRTLSEIDRIMNKESYLYIGLPCEGGWLRDTLRALTTSRTISHRYGIDYNKVSKIEHCNKACDVIKVVGERFKVLKRKFFPFTFLHYVGINLTVSIELQKRQEII